MSLNDDGSGGWGCLLLAAILLVGLACVGVTYVDDWIGIQASKAQAELHRAEAARAQAQAERERAAAVRDVTQSVRARAAAVDVLPWLPVIVVVVLLAPGVLALLAVAGGDHGAAGR